VLYGALVVLPAEFVQTKLAEGPETTNWLTALPGLVEELLSRWNCEPDGAVMHGQVAIVVPVKHSEHGSCVLKVSFPHPRNVHEPDAYGAWSGRGAVMLHERDDERFALLLERASTSTLLDETTDSDQAFRAAGSLSRRLAITAPPGMPPLADEAENWETEMRADAVLAPHHLSRRAIDAALATVRDLGRVQPNLMVHGDFHATNILRADREPWLAIDPKGYAGDPAYDVRMVVAWRPLRSLRASELRTALHRGLDIFAEAAGLDPLRVRRWAQFQAVKAALGGRRSGFRTPGHKSRADYITEFTERAAEPLTEMLGS